MSEIAIVVFVIAAAVCVLGALYGAIKTHNGFLGVAANLSIPLWFGSVIFALSLPHYPGWDIREIAMLAVVVILGIAMAVLNQRDNNKMLEKLK